MSATDHAPTASLDMLRRRAAVLNDVRSFFHARGFWEVETPLLSADTVVERHLDPVRVDDPTFAPQPMWLQTSPELAMKRLLAAGADAIFQVARCVRGGESGARHNPEFTMVEWYRAGDDYEAGMQLLADFAEQLLGRGRPLRLTYREAFQRELNLDPFDAKLELLIEAAERRKLNVSRDFSDDRDEWLNLLLAACIEPELGVERPVILHDYPATQAALAQVRDAPEPFAERFELYDRGVELANGYHELLDAEELLRRNREVNRARERDGKRRLPEASRMVDAMRTGLPACSGCALGLDRLVMMLGEAKSIREVIAFPIDRA